MTLDILIAGLGLFVGYWYGWKHGHHSGHHCERENNTPDRNYWRGDNETN